MRLLRSLKSTHWVIWSSPLLLLVLVLTLTASTPRHDPASPTTTSTTTVPLRHVAHPHHTTSTTPKKKTAEATSPSGRARTSAPSDDVSSSSTASSDRPIASASAVTAASGALSGQLGPSFESAEVPFEGPGTWTIAASAPVRATLLCQGTAIDLTSEFTVGARDYCQLSLSPATPGASLTWQVTPVG